MKIIEHSHLELILSIEHQHFSIVMSVYQRVKGSYVQNPMGSNPSKMEMEATSPWAEQLTIGLKP